jgi:hypothetical protein
MTQTAVEWFIEQLNELGYDLRLIPNHIDQANKMFKEQIIQAAQYEPFLGDLPRTEGEPYFEKTFKKD